MGFLTGHELTWMLEALQILPDELPNIDVMISSQYSPQLADAFNVPLAELLAASERLNAAGIQTQNFAGEKTTEPSVFGWIPLRSCTSVTAMGTRWSLSGRSQNGKSAATLRGRTHGAEANTQGACSPSQFATDTAASTV
jgi:hypothetical protein